ncbi:hypothetical protein FQN50_009516 [Emmonsiellopsis sp. PD_5]|nr:hypothetical protein FQN50_009516 [Emmonsiellopsis sp. PD_5]
MTGPIASGPVVYPTDGHKAAENGRAELPNLSLLTADYAAAGLDNPRLCELPDAILEEDEETASEPAEPVTPNSETHPHPFREEPPHLTPLAKPVIINTDATPPSTPPKPIPASRPTTASTTTSTTPRPSPLRTASKSLRSLFRRKNSSSGDESAPNTLTPSPTETRPPEHVSIFTAVRNGSFSSPPRNSPTTSRSGSPATPSSPSSTLNGGSAIMLSSSSPSESSFFKKSTRSTTGLSLKDRGRIVFGATPKPQRTEPRIRSPSLSDVRDQVDPVFSIPAMAGVGLKARRMSASLPDDFQVSTCELSDEYVSASKVPGRRGKSIGVGSTATVKIMCRKGSKKGDFFAVKEFRKCGQKEDPKEYEKKVKSEFSIANSLDHPNIVKSFRLCTHGGRWNHVMEFCSYGELYSIVEKGKITLEDKLCFFKQTIRGVAYLHANGIAHRDIKLENLLLTSEGRVKITDFGVSEVFSGIHPGLRSAGGECGKDMKDVTLCSPGICGSMPYIAPEVLAKKDKYDPRTLDVWSCAMVYVTLHYGGCPWTAADAQYPNYAKFINGWNKWLETNDPDTEIAEDNYPRCGPVTKYIGHMGMKRLILRMLHPIPSQRATIQDVMTDRYFKVIDCCAPEPLDESKIITSIDAAGKGSCKLANKMLVQKAHKHLPPPEKKFLPQHRFDMGDGYQ